MLPPKIYLLDSKYVLDILFLTAYVYCHFFWHKTAGPCSSKLSRSCVKWAQHCGQMQGLKRVRFMSLHLIDAQFRRRLWNNFSCLVCKIFLKGLLSGSYWMAEVGWWEEPCNLHLAHMTPSPVCKRLQTNWFKIQDARLPEHFLNRRIWVQDSSAQGLDSRSFLNAFWILNPRVCKRLQTGLGIFRYIYIYILISPSCPVIILTIIHSNRWSGNIYIYTHTYTCIWLVVSTPPKNMSSSVGMIIPKTWKI